MTSSSPRAQRSFARVRVGIGSWADPEYTGVLYPKGIAAGERLAAYATQLDHVEVNSSYYATPKRETVATWAKQTPKDFLFDVKLHRVCSQSPAKAAQGGQVGRLLENLAPLIAAGKFGVFLLVLPPAFAPERRDLAELDGLVEKLRPHLLAVELRHNGWVAGAQKAVTLGFFRSRGLVWIAVDMPKVRDSTIMPAVDEVTNPALAYLRLHGRNKQWLEVKSAAERHAYSYNAAELKAIAARVGKLAGRADAVRVVANNHAEDFAPKTALALKRLPAIARRRR